MSVQHTSQPLIVHELEDDDKVLISEIFYEHIVPRLMRMGARIGNMNCDFAGTQYKEWVLEFRSVRSGLEIVNFEYDQESRSFRLPHWPPADEVGKNHV